MLAQMIIKQTIEMWVQTHIEMLDILSVEAFKQGNPEEVFKDFKQTIVDFYTELGYKSVYSMPVDKEKVMALMDTLEALQRKASGEELEEDEDDYWL